MNLYQSVLPHVRMGTAGRAPVDRAVLLTWLAKQQIETPGLMPPAIVSGTLAANAAESLTGEALLEAWQEYVLAVHEERGAEERPVTWMDLPPGVTGIEMTRRNVQAALRLLLDGSAPA